MAAPQPAAARAAAQPAPAAQPEIPFLKEGTCTISYAHVVLDGGCCAGTLGGHVMIIIRGKQPGNEEGSTKDFHGYYHIGGVLYEKNMKGFQTLSSKVQDKCGNLQGVIRNIIVEQDDCPLEWDKKIESERPFSNITHTQAMNLIKEIFKEKAELARTGLGIPYQKAGCKRWELWGGNGGHNCATWAEEMLSRIGIYLPQSAKDSKFVHPKTRTSNDLTVLGGAACAVALVIGAIFKG